MLNPFASPWRPAVEMMPAPAAQRPGVTPRPEERPEARAEPAAAGDYPVKFETAVAALEKQLLEAALAAEKGHQRKAADRLGLSYHQMRGLLRKYGYGRGADAADPGPLSDGPLEG